MHLERQKAKAMDLERTLIILKPHALKRRLNERIVRKWTVSC